MKASPTESDSLLPFTRQVWQPRLGRDLSGEDARQIIQNTTGFFALLAEWARAETRSPANGTVKMDAFEMKEVCHDR